MSGNSQWRNGSPWRDPDVLQVLLVGTLATVFSAGLIYFWFLWRTWSVARSATQDPGEADCVVVFGKRLQDSEPDLEYRWRLRAALRLLRARPQVSVVLTGGHSEGPNRPSEAEVARRWLLARMPEAAPRLTVEQRSRDTIENLREVRALVPQGQAALLSSRYHLARCQALARSLGIDAHVCAAEPTWLLTRRNATCLLLEAGYHTLFVVGRRWAALIGHQRMLARVR